MMRPKVAMLSNAGSVWQRNVALGLFSRGPGVDDGFRTRDLRIHNPAL